MKFELNGREYEDYELNNGQIVELLEGDHDVTDMGREFLMKKVYERFKSTLCPRSGETNDDVFARFFSDYVNNCGHDEQKAADRMARDHRTLQSEMFKLCMAYIKNLAENTKEGRFDPRNEYACKTSQKMLDYLDSIDYPY
jgi:hypothetical protein